MRSLKGICISTLPSVARQRIVRGLTCSPIWGERKDSRNCRVLDVSVNDWMSGLWEDLRLIRIRADVPARRAPWLRPPDMPIALQAQARTKPFRLGDSRNQATALISLNPSNLFIEHRLSSFPEQARRRPLYPLKLCQVVELGLLETFLCLRFLVSQRRNGCDAACRI